MAADPQGDRVEGATLRTLAIGGGWGHHISWLDGGRAKPVGLDDGTVGQGPRRVYGHMSRRPKVGERLTAEMQSGRTALFVFTEVRYERDPDDMFFGTVEFVEYVEALSASTTKEANGGR